MPRKTNVPKEDTITITKEELMHACASAIEGIISDAKSDPNAPADVGIMLTLTSMVIVPAIVHELFGKQAE